MSHWTLVISASDLEECNDIAEEEMFGVSLSATGDEPATHYWSGIGENYKTRIVPLLSSISSLQIYDRGSFSRDQILDDIGLLRIGSKEPPPR